MKIGPDSVIRHHLHIREEVAMASGHPSPKERAVERRVLVIADESCINADLCQLVAEHVQGTNSKVLVVAPALNTRLRHYASDTDEAEQRARYVLDDTLRCMRRHGIAATGELGDADPLIAINDWLSEFSADEIVIATHSADELNWLEKGVVNEARRRFGAPVTHAVIARSSRAASAFVP
jgi:hypothetical protein